MLEPLLISEPDAARAMNCSAKTISRLVATGKLKVVRINRRKLYDVADLRDFIRQNKTSGATDVNQAKANT